MCVSMWECMHEYTYMPMHSCMRVCATLWVCCMHEIIHHSWNCTAKLQSRIFLSDESGEWMVFIYMYICIYINIYIYTYMCVCVSCFISAISLHDVIFLWTYLHSSLFRRLCQKASLTLKYKNLIENHKTWKVLLTEV